VLGPHRRPVKREHAAPLKDAIKDGVREGFLVQDAAQAVSALVAVKIMVRFFRCRSLIT
jgi:hypothetical protein